MARSTTNPVDLLTSDFPTEEEEEADPRTSTDTGLSKRRTAGGEWRRQFGKEKGSSSISDSLESQRDRDESHEFPPPPVGRKRTNGETRPRRTPSKPQPPQPQIIGAPRSSRPYAPRPPVSHMALDHDETSLLMGEYQPLDDDGPPSPEGESTWVSKVAKKDGSGTSSRSPSASSAVGGGSRQVVVHDDEEGDVSDDCFCCVPWAYHFCLTPSERRALERLKKMAAVKYDPDNPHHEALLRRYWQAAFPDKPCLMEPNPGWKDLGFQSENPRTDFRGGGVLSLSSMLYFAEKYPQEFQEVLRETQSNTKLFYPFSAAFVNISFMLVCFLKLNDFIPGCQTRNGDAVASRKAIRNFAQLAVYPENNAFEELFCACCIRLHRSLKSDVFTDGISNFSTALRNTRAGVAAVLGRDVKRVEDFRVVVTEPVRNKSNGLFGLWK